MTLFGLSKDPIIKIYCCQTWLNIPLSHALPIIKENFPNYDTALPRFCNYLEQKLSSPISLIDVGANVGDTINQVKNQSSLSGLCIEPSLQFYPLLLENTKNLSNVECMNSFVFDDNNTSLEITEERGTGISTISANAGLSVPSFTLDYILESKFKNFKNSEILKVDTDGWDLQVLEGAIKYIKVSKPFLFFEFSPYHYLNVGKRNSSSLLTLLKSIGYHVFLLYDGEGFLMGTFDLNKSTEAQVILKVLFDYGNKRTSFYCDILAAHKSKSELLIDFYKKEVEQN